MLPATREEPKTQHPLPLSPAKTVLLGILGVAGYGALMLVPAGRLDWLPAWTLMGLLVLHVTGNLLYLLRVNPEQIAARSRIGEGTKTWDKVWLGSFTPGFLAILIVAGLDARWGWSAMPDVLWGVGLALFVVGSLLFSWAMGVNPFFEKTVRIQHERGHRVIDSGPYRYVRHPGYVGFGLGWILGMPLVLGSWWALIPTAVSLVALVIRTALEDRTLQAELEGYADYAQRVRYRLLPGVW